MLVVIALLLLPGCAITASSPGRSTIIASLSYELPLHADVKSVVDVLEASSAGALKEPVTVDAEVGSFVSGDAIDSVILLETSCLRKGPTLKNRGVKHRVDSVAREGLPAQR
jgi:hypothetical protein